MAFLANGSDADVILPLPYSKEQSCLDMENGKEAKPSKPVAKDLFDVIGPFGRWQLLIFFIIAFCSFTNSWNILMYPFEFPTMTYWCASPYPDIDNVTWREYGVPYTSKGGARVYSGCTRYDVRNLTWEAFKNETVHPKTVPCDAWAYDTTWYDNTAVQQWNIVCESESLTSLTQTIFMFGYMVAVLMTGQISDSYGRKPTLLMSAVILSTAAIINALSVNYLMFAITRFFIGFGSAATITVSFVILVEVVGPKYRDTVGVGNLYGWCLGYILLPLLAWYLNNWVYLQLAVSVATVMLFLAFWLLPESPRWLLTHGRILRAEELLTSAAKMNRVYSPEATPLGITAVVTEASQLREKERELQKTKKANEKSANFFDLFRTPNLRKRSLNIYFIWFVADFVYYGMSYNSDALGGNPYINFLLAGVIEVPAYTFCIVLLKKMGRKYSIMGELVIGGICCIAVCYVPPELQWLKLTIAMGGKLCITACFASIYVYTTELFPTVIRNVGLGSASIFGRFGSMAAPFVSQIDKFAGPKVTMLVFGGLSIVSGVLLLFLPETNGREVPDTIEEAERFE